MKCTVLVVLVTAFTLVHSMPPETTSTTARSSPSTMPPFGDTIKKLTNQLMEINTTSSEVVTLDTRTPPKVKQQQKIKAAAAAQEVENSHAGVAIPIDEDSIELEETTKKLNFYKIERPTTNSGLSTWILLSGQNALSTKPPKKTTTETTEKERNVTLVVTDNPNKVGKPLFKKRTTTTKKPVTSTTTTKSVPSTTKKSDKETTKLTKIKASVLNSALNKKNITNNSTSTKKKTSTTEKPGNTITTPLIKIKQENSTAVTPTDSNNLPIEAKDGDSDIPSTTDASKKKKTVTKRKKNKNRRRKPDTNSNSTRIDKHKTKEKPIGTQLYNYLSREVMPTVGVGLVGLVVTAGLASYFLYPFGVARRSYEVDRKDKEGTYYYSDEYSGGIAEEEAIGKVIAGMPMNSFYTNTYKTPTSRNTYSNMRYRKVDHRTAQIYPQGSVETVQLSPKQQETIYDTYQPINSENMEQKFVVGNIPKDISDSMTPVAVPEHGPRNLRMRKRRSNDLSNEIDNDNFVSDTTEGLLSTTTSQIGTTTEDGLSDKYSSFVYMMKELFHLKVRLGLQLIKNATESISKYVSTVQSRLDEHYNNYTRTRN